MTPGEKCGAVWRHCGGVGPACSDDELYSCRACGHHDISRWYPPEVCPTCGNAPGAPVDPEVAKARREALRQKEELEKQNRRTLWAIRDAFSEKVERDPELLLRKLGDLLNDTGDKEGSAKFHDAARKLAQ